MQKAFVVFFKGWRIPRVLFKHGDNGQSHLKCIEVWVQNGKWTNSSYRSVKVAIEKKKKKNIIILSFLINPCFQSAQLSSPEGERVCKTHARWSSSRCPITSEAQANCLNLFLSWQLQQNLLPLVIFRSREGDMWPQRKPHLQASLLRLRTGLVFFFSLLKGATPLCKIILTGFQEVKLPSASLCKLSTA